MYINYIWVINNFIAYWGVTCIRGLTVIKTMPADVNEKSQGISSYGVDLVLLE